jgi:hypothetical protein
MSEDPLTVRTRIEEISLSHKENVDDGSKGYMDVRYWLESGDDLLGFATVRVYFKRTDVPLDELTSDAVAHGRNVLSQIAEHYTPAQPDTSSENLWVG